MTQPAALKAFFSSFDIPAYPTAAVPDNAPIPRIDYELVIASFGEQVGITVNLWMQTESEAEINSKAKEIADKIGAGGCLLPCDEGAIWVTKGAPWCQSLTDSINSSIKRRYMNVTLEYLTI